ncbi:CRISPR-associated endoribonuclease Cas6 [Anaerostipes sp. 992a]|uniref:CRISPR-associated endoribonuclease Cas6 n=1 Tax=Anaerostipes sp. 992a TaxID=1261637 RepID=UPI0009522F1F|nr:CRISPR-associated endoribonuclease Cas6 [Anaerostipes sp. 992a]OLR64019.1 CRISPR-associated endoribonuclease Cas6 [Anaerostipes sp. 992a]
MLAKLELQIEYDYKEKLSYQISSVMHGILMEYVSSDYGDKLHLNGTKPFHQYVSQISENGFLWTICTLNQEAKENIIDSLIIQNHFLMKHKNLELTVKNRELTVISYDKLIEKYYFQQQHRDITIQFVTPTAFKSQGKYVFIPNIKLLLQSLMIKYDAFSDETNVGGQEVLEHFEQYAFIKKYHLRSVRYSLEGVWISGFLGEITIRINGPEPLVNLAHMLIRFGEYSGIGIKCSLGMGTMIVKEGKGNDR